MRVLIVENEHVVAKAMSYALESRGHRVDIANSIEAALALSTPEVLIADPERPGLSGLDLLERYRRQGLAPRTVFVSSEPSLESCRRALRLGASEFLSKPFRLEELVRAVELETGSPEALFEETYITSKSCVEVAMRDLAAFALRQGIAPTCRARCCTALGELLDNVCRHAYLVPGGELRVTATIDRRDLIVTVSDDGVGVDACELAIDFMSIGGGLARASALAEDLEIQTGLPRGTTVTLRFGAYLVDYGDEVRADLTELDFLTPDTSREILNTLEFEDGEQFFQLPPSLAVVIGRLLAKPDPRRLIAQAFRS
jgi:CheY-like chemotaxis protein